MSRRLFELILAVKRKCQSNEDRIQEEMGLSQAEFNGLIVLDEDAALSGCAFAERMALSPSRGSRVLDRLVTNGYVKAIPGPEDRRAVVVSLTPRGRRAKGQIARHMGACERRIRGNLDGRSIEQIERALELLNAML